MRHQKKGFKLGRTHSHRKATLSALSNALIMHKRITTTLTKARALRMHVEPIISRAKEDSTHNRRQVFRYLQDKQAVTELFGEVSQKVGDRPGGYTRIIKLGQRAGDAAEMAIIELVDYNDDGSSTSSKQTSRRRTRRGRRKKVEEGAAATTASAVAEAEETVAEVEEEVVDEVEETVEEVAAEAEEEVSNESDEAADGEDEEKKEE
ncbi:MAG: 50S ribosomal protein L17 [Rhodothermaceae bacterium]|nr:50S ribosomal protein L17 [Rhodothermaceae bacterium]